VGFISEEYGPLGWLCGFAMRDGNGVVQGADKGRFAATGGDVFHGLDLAVAHQKRAIEIVDTGTNVTR
jgi:hypothetical protein